MSLEHMELATVQRMIERPPRFPFGEPPIGYEEVQTTADERYPRAVMKTHDDMKEQGYEYIGRYMTWPDPLDYWRRKLPEQPKHPNNGRAATAKELRHYAADIIGAEISDRVAARRQYSAAGVALLDVACKLLRAGKHVEMVSEREGE